ncbi:lytic murein transglycosylase [Agromyces sp. H66]|uniref:lytic transglycosylase domain-containing protein n=1 Tax=Agromyces sp. H66 TaxID=2529859 RepID=UPI0010AB4A78|nr:lytic murein transglycosylase [Agromyces sp. H66]
MSWDDFDGDEFGEQRRPNRATGAAGAWQAARKVLGYVGVVTGVVALAAGSVFAVSTLGIAAKPGGFEAPPAKGASVALPPVVLVPESGEQVAGGPEANEAAAGSPESGLSGSAGSDVPVQLVPQISPEWMSRIAAATGIPERALSAYASAHVSIAEEQPECGLDWTTIAAIGSIESDHGSHGDSVLDADGYSSPTIIGRALDGNGVAKIADTDGGLFDGDTTWDRAVGPMQFIPSTWIEWASDGNGDDVTDPNQIDDAALATARYLCASGSMTSADGWRAAVYSYNHDNDYVDKVARVAIGFAEAVE